MNNGTVSGNEPVKNVISVSAAIESIEHQQISLTNMVNDLGSMLYGESYLEGVSEPKAEGFESQLNEIVSTNERLICTLERILSRI
jgi:hypothetical protein